MLVYQKVFGMFTKNHAFLGDDVTFDLRIHVVLHVFFLELLVFSKFIRDAHDPNLGGDFKYFVSLSLGAHDPIWRLHIFQMGWN